MVEFKKDRASNPTLQLLQPSSSKRVGGRPERKYEVKEEIEMDNIKGRTGGRGWEEGRMRRIK